MKFGIPMIWREQQNHFDDCYFCLVKIVGINRNKWTYPDAPSARRPVSHSESVPVPTYHTLPDVPNEKCDENRANSDSASDYGDSDLTPRVFFPKMSLII